MKIEAKLKGLEDALAALRGIKRGIANRVLKAELMKLGRRAAKVAKGLAPRKGGVIRKSVAAVSRRARNANVSLVVVGPRKGMAGVGADGRPVDPAKVAHLVEGGRKRIVMQNGGKRLYDRYARKFFGKAVAAVQARPFMGPAADAVTADGVQQLKAGIEAGIAREAVKHARKGKSIVG
jgi:hypothetical protein